MLFDRTEEAEQVVCLTLDGAKPMSLVWLEQPNRERYDVVSPISASLT